MTMSRTIAQTAVCGIFLLSPVACDSGPSKEASATASAKSAANKAAAKSKASKPGANKGAPNPHAAPPTNPHGSPAAGGVPPMANNKEPGPPRDITPSGEVVAASVRGLTLSVPKEWESSPPTSSMRLAQWVLPGPGGDGELVVYRFPGGGGGVTANIDRWKGQFQPPEGKTIDDVSTLTTIDGEGELKTTLVDVTGTYVAAVMPGADDKHNDSEYRMFAAVVEGSGDAYYFKTVGPSKTLALWADPFTAVIGTFKVAAEAGSKEGAAKAGATPAGSAQPAAAGKPPTGKDVAAAGKDVAAAGKDAAPDKPSGTEASATKDAVPAE